MKMLFFIDGDNNITTGLNGIQHLTEEDTVLVFHSQGMALSKIRARCATSRAKVSFIESVKDGKNSVDFQIVAELGVRIGKNEVQFAYIISQDQGYVPSITMLKKCYGDLFCEIGLADSIESCLNLTFLLRTRTRLELYTSLCREYGDAKGDLVFKHLKELFEMPEVNYAPAAEPIEEPLPAPAEETAEEPAPETVTEEIAEPEPEPVPDDEEKEPEPAPAPVVPEEGKTEPMEEPVPAEPEEVKEEPVKTDVPEIPEAVKSEPAEVPAPAPAEESKEEPKPEPKAESKPFMTVPKTFVVASGAVIPGGAISSAEKKIPETAKAETPKPEEAKPVKKPQPKKSAVKTEPKSEAKPAEKTAEAPAAEPVKAEEKTENKEAAPEKPAKTSRRRSSAKKKADEGSAPAAETEAAAPAAEPAPVKEADKPAEAPKAEEPAPETAAKDAPVSDAAPAVRNHTMKLYAAPFEKILAGKKSVEIRCNDTKRQKLRVGDTITFEKQTNEGGTLTVRVTSLDTYPTFEELIEAKGLTVLGCEPEDTPESCLKKLLRIYGKRQVQTYGAVAIGIELIP